MAFKVLFMAHARDADKEKHCSEIKTSVYHLYVVVVKNQEEAVEVAKTYAEKKQIESLILCPGFSHGDVAEIFGATEGKVAVSVARNDGPSSRISQRARNRAAIGGKEKSRDSKLT
jgi:phosphoribosylformylglycinamidine (FGAM) synthase-like amidotransferase family enzyme